ncbi:MAG: YdcF family protein [Actinomycetota bacterium]
MIFGPLKLAIRIVSLLLSACVLYFAVTVVQVWVRSGEHSTAQAQAILVFGTAENNGVPSDTLRERLKQVVILWDEHRAPWVIVTGGKQPGDRYTEAEASATWLVEHGVPRSRILEASGADTWQNVASSIPLLQSHSITTVLAVSDPFHEYRAMAICADQGLTPLPSPTRTSWVATTGNTWKFILREAVAVSAGRIIGYDTLSSWSSGISALHPHVNGG